MPARTGILAMTVVLVRGEAAGEMRTLTASGGTSLTRRAITGWLTSGRPPATLTHRRTD